MGRSPDMSLGAELSENAWASPGWEILQLLQGPSDTAAPEVSQVHKLTPKASRFCSGRGQSSLWESRVAVDKTEGELKFPRKEQLRRLLWELRSIPAVYLSWVSPSALFSSLSIGPFPFSNLSLTPSLSLTLLSLSISSLGNNLH